MTLDFFINSYNFDEFNIEKAVLNNGVLKIYVTINAHLELIANGYRPELDVDYDTSFSFKVDKDNEVIDDLSSFDCYKKDNFYYIEIGKYSYKLISNDILVEK